MHDSKNVRHSPVGRVDLRWSRQETAKSHAETFYVVDRAEPLVILGAPAFVEDVPSAGQTIHPIGLKQQTAGKLLFGFELIVDAADFPSMTEEEKAEMERKKKEAAQRRSLETKEQERREAVRRQQDPG